MPKSSFLNWRRVLRSLRKRREAIGTFLRMQAQMRQDLYHLRKSFEEHRGEMRVILAGMSLPDPKLWVGQPEAIAGQPAENAFPNSVVCRQESFRTTYFPYWTARLGEGLRYHRKLWEFVFVCQALWERGAIRPGARGLGFGVGIEPLSAYFASQDCTVVATDMGTVEATAIGWVSTNEHAAGKEALRKPAVCPDTLFDRNVEFRQCDMNAVPEDLVDFDFCWSACALEHLGSIEAGLAFIERSIRCLKPGGWAIHTTELNLSSNYDTVDNMDTVLFRRRDLDGLADRLRAQGHRVASFDYEPGIDPLDTYIDVPPYREQPHLKMALWGYSITSIGIIVQRGE